MEGKEGLKTGVGWKNIKSTLPVCLLSCRVRHVKGYGRAAAAILCALMVLTGPLSAGGTAQPDDEYVSHPSRIPLFDDYSTPQIVPGGDGTLKFSLTNRYAYNITDVRLELGIYKFSNLDTSEALDHQDEVPGFTSGSAGSFSGVADGPEIGFDVPMTLGNGDSVDVSIRIHAPVFSELGTYLVRTHLQFGMENGTYHMYSRGYFPDTPWYEYEKQKNLTKLGEQSDLPGLHAIIPDTTFGVKEPTDYTCLWLIVAVIVLFAILSTLFYLMDERGRFPRTKEKLDRMWDRVRGRR